ncbi:MAG: carotenoid 1,2-hydratase [Acidobacteria bacterium]|nr:MAG: carotenoid 1,2-hydratase [Acidobacteriota bacterium]
MLRALAITALVLMPPVEEWRVAVPDYAWSFPRDHWAHDGYRTEWWYFTGHLEGGGRRFGYQFTFFRIGIVSEPIELALDSDWASSHVIMGHAAVTDLESGQHVFSEVLYREMPLLASFDHDSEERIGWSRGPAGTKALWTLDFTGDGFRIAARDDRLEMGFELTTRAAKPRIFQGPGGFSRKGKESGAASQYYSYTRLETSGELTMGGERFEVVGESWMDKEFSSSQLEPQQVGWDWFSLQLDDGRELMLYIMRREDGTTDYAKGTVVSPDGEARYLELEDFSFEATRYWVSPSTGARYPVAWRVRVPSEGLELEVRALVDDQENKSRFFGGVYYWEGAVTISVTGLGGEALGRGFVELTGYGEGNRPPV